MSPNTTCILVTGANSGLGFAICCRLIDEFLETRDAAQKLCVIPTTRSQSKADATVKRLQSHLVGHCRKAHRDGDGDSEALKSRISIQPELLDLCNILNVQRASKRLRQKYEKIDAVILNAGMGGWLGVDFWIATKQFFRDGIYFVTRPEFKIGAVGLVSPSQVPVQERHEAAAKEANGTADARAEPGLGEVFTANVFGHYLLVHYLMPLLSRRAGQDPGRVIWVGTLEAYHHTFSIEDLQGMETNVSYESSKRLTDLLALTASAPSSKPYTDSFFAYDSAPTIPRSRTSAIEAQDESLTPRKASLRASTRARSSTPNGRASSRTSSPARSTRTSSATTVPPTMYTSQPGMMVTDIMQVHWLLIYAWIGVLYVARWYGSPWHNVQPYAGATAMTHMALAPKKDLDSLGKGDGASIKWGSATNWRGNERVKITEVNWLYDEKGVQAGKEEQERFFEVGREVWKRMEEMRGQWEKRLRDAGYDEGLS